MNRIGNVSSAVRDVFVDRTAPPAPTVNPIEGDNRVSFLERQNGVQISGAAEPDADVRVNWNGAGAHDHRECQRRLDGRLHRCHRPDRRQPQACP